MQKDLEKKILDKNTKETEINTNLTTVIARTEALNVVVSIINAYMSEHKLTDKEIGAIQKAVSEESAKTDALFNELKKLIDEV